MGLFGNRVPAVSPKYLKMFAKDDNGNIETQFNYLVSDAKGNQSSKYTVDMSLINHVMGVMQDFNVSQIKTGIKMQNEDGPQSDWAIAGGIASGLFGPSAGAAAAIATMQDNIESTRKHHELGRQIEESARQNYDDLNKSWDALKKVEVKQISINRVNNFEYSEIMPELLNCFKPESVFIPYTNTIQLVETTMLGSIRIHDINELRAYNSIGFFRANIYIKNNFHELFPTEDNKEIDGSFKVVICDGNRNVAYSYIMGDTGAYDNSRAAGFKNDIKTTLTFKLFDRNEIVDINKNYSLKFYEPNLWLVKQIGYY